MVRSDPGSLVAHAAIAVTFQHFCSLRLCLAEKGFVTHVSLSHHGMPIDGRREDKLDVRNEARPLCWLCWFTLTQLGAGSK